MNEMLASSHTELVALYGRRRIGKTYLVRQHVQPRAGTYLEVTGTKNGSGALQRRRFREALERVFAGDSILPDFRSWDDALAYLADLVERRATERPREPIVLFFDELPWMATPRSRLLEAIDHLYNARLSRLPQVKLILCGSAASWMLRRIVRAKGGLHNRITRQVRLDPFTLRETEDFLVARGLRFTRREILELYMALGGVPHYLGLIERAESVAEAVGRLCFERTGPLRTEFEDVFASLFDDHDDHIAILRKLASRQQGLTRNELIAGTRFSSGGGLNRRLVELEEAGFIARIEPYRARVKNTLYRVIDEYCLFYLAWIDGAPRGVLARGGAARWQSTAQSPSYRSWTGYAFESVCLKHARELEHALGVENLVMAVGAWRWLPRRNEKTERGAQVDLLFDRRDGVINLFEMKFATEPFVVTKSYARELEAKLSVFELRTRPRKRLVLTLVSPAGLKPNVWSADLVDRVLDVDALF